MSHAQLQQEIANTLALAGQNWSQGSTTLNTAFAKLLNTLDNMGGCYELPLATLSHFYDNISLHMSSSPESAYASFSHLVSHLYRSSIFLFHSSTYMMLTHLCLCLRHTCSDVSFLNLDFLFQRTAP